MRAPTPKEAQDQAAFVELVQRVINPGWRFTHVPNGEHRNKRTGAKLLRMGVSRGVPDFLFFGPRMVIGLELKRRRGGALTLEQMNWGEHLTRCGFFYFATNSIADVLGELFALGVISRVEVSA